MTKLLRGLGTDRERIEPQVLELVRAQLHALARRLMERERPDHTLQPTILVHEAWMRLAKQERAEWQGRGQFFALASRAMRQLLVNHARDRKAAKRLPPDQRRAIESILAVYEDRQLDVLVLDDALARLGEEDPRASKVVVLRYFGGLSLPEAAEAMGVSLRTAERSWTVARKWLEKELGPDSD
ncbi:MAG: sigma-70 family RNA polymerase sigma factor [bacterium]|nr:sigma-70 family RNA polymerase sigma factor [bacterium]